MMMATTRANPLDTSIPDATSSQPFFCNKKPDAIFHLSPFVQLHKNTISPIHATDISLEDEHPGFVECSGLSDNIPENQSSQVSRESISCSKLYILLITLICSSKTCSLICFLLPVALLKPTFYSKLLALIGKYGSPNKTLSIKLSVATHLCSNITASCWRRLKTSYALLTTLWGMFVLQSDGVVLRWPLNMQCKKTTHCTLQFQVRLTSSPHALD